jgi:hypothetical protein
MEAVIELPQFSLTPAKYFAKASSVSLMNLLSASEATATVLAKIRHTHPTIKQSVLIWCLLWFGSHKNNRLRLYPERYQRKVE